MQPHHVSLPQLVDAYRLANEALRAFEHARTSGTWGLEAMEMAAVTKEQLGAASRSITSLQLRCKDLAARAL